MSPLDGIAYTERAVTTWREDLLRLRSMKTRILQDIRGIVGVDEVVEWLRDAVETEHFVRVKATGKGESQVRVT